DGAGKTLLRPILGSIGGMTHNFNLAPGTHRIASVDQTDGTPALGTTSYSYNIQGSRIADDNIDPSTHIDARTFTYDARDNLITVTGHQFDPQTSEAQTYIVRRAFDARNRRVF